jgi:hypothetical protein
MVRCSSRSLPSKPSSQVVWCICYLVPDFCIVRDVTELAETSVGFAVHASGWTQADRRSADAATANTAPIEISDKQRETL